MEDDEFELQLQQILSNENTQNPEYFKLLNDFISNISNLPRTVERIPNYQNNPQFLMNILTLIRKILEKNGSHLEMENLHFLINSYFPIIQKLAPEIIRGPIAPIACDVAAYLYRFIYELALQESPPFDPLFQLVSSPNEPDIILGLIMMVSVIDLMKEPLKHVRSSLNNQISNSFEQKHISVYLNVASGKLKLMNRLIIPFCLKLILAIFKFFNRKAYNRTFNPLKREEHDFDFDFVVPENMKQFYTDFSFIQNLFIVFNETQNEEAIDCISYFTCAHSLSWKKFGIPPVLYINTIEPYLTEILRDQKNGEKATFSVTNFISKIGRLIFVSDMTENPELSGSLIQTIQQYSLLLFPQFSDYYNSCFNLIKFWKVIVSNNSFYQKYKEFLPEVYMSIFQSYINSLIDSVSNDLLSNTYIEKFNDCNQLIEYCTPLFEIAQICGEPSLQFIINFIKLQIPLLIENKDVNSLLRLSVVILVISSFFEGSIDLIRSYQDRPISPVPFISLCIQSVFDIIDKTNPIQEGLVEVFGAHSTFFEESILCFSSRFINKLFGRSSVLFSKEIFQFMKVEKNQLFEMVMVRLLKDLFILAPFPETLDRIVTFLSSLSNTIEMETFLSSNDMIGRFVSHQLLISPDSFDSQERLYSIISKLNSFFCGIISYEQLGDFLSFFDSKFNDLSFSNFSNQTEALMLYREINGVLKGATSSNKYTYIFRWMLRNHSEHTLNCLKANSEDPFVVKAIIRVLINMLNAENLNLPGYSSEGLQLIILVSKLLLIINENVSKDDSIRLYTVKILIAAITSKNANYGIMKMYGDDTIDQIIHMLFYVLNAWTFEEYSDYKNLIISISEAISTILKFAPEMVENDAHFPIILDFFNKAFLKIKDSFNDYSKKYRSIYSSFYELLNYFVEKQMFGLWKFFRPHLVVLLNTFFVTSSIGLSFVYKPLFLLIKYDDDYAAELCKAAWLSKQLEDSNRPEIEVNLKALLQTVRERNKPNKKVFENLEKVMNALKRFSVQIPNLG